jgi:hypothetical protein
MKILAMAFVSLIAMGSAHAEGTPPESTPANPTSIDNSTPSEGGTNSMGTQKNQKSTTRTKKSKNKKDMVDPATTEKDPANKEMSGH